MIQSAYIHIPFCHHICHYCDFTKIFYNESMANDYIEALGKEMSICLPEVKSKIRTIFIGGGTPTALNLAQLEKLLQLIHQYFDVASCEEFTIEANPGDFTEEKIRLLKHFGVNRVSLGVQVFDNQLLKAIGRAHQVQDVYRSINDLTKNEFKNISIDLIYALPHQTVANFEATVKEALSFQLPHYSAYSLQVEPQTIFYNRYQKGDLHRPEQEEEVKMYNILRKNMAHQGLKQYEISNFAKPSYESKHNLTYWNNEYYYGFGAGASSYLPGKRMMNIRAIPAYMKQANKHNLPVMKVDTIGLKERLEEEFFLGLRKRSGINKRQFNEKFGFPYDRIYKKQVKELIRKNWLVEDCDSIRLTEEGLLFGNDVFQYFLLDEQEINHVN
ncbi:oxygen-independent coproporphyrinogen-3 oxidase [Cerasibacillus quisquiliarum]|uniref:Heme chaperone HemW n=1 Tax=Cerasibacillus quisquiliarum TaxID=227865 RepID=A0A511UWP6_9BACI|nr:radical SAM family heme chaperone HemW [Cerasibacillus quisquiliarum]MBB5145554.1 oxygen-independent coproporphyrinogen-3 oxidase [Cerasibacillus quisquiliarum]GEN31050.1 coproporphyrinogen III oxidase [Cerasibacillus quisquiliarum]